MHKKSEIDSLNLLEKHVPATRPAKNAKPASASKAVAAAAAAASKPIIRKKGTVVSDDESDDSDDDLPATSKSRIAVNKQQTSVASGHEIGTIVESQSSASEAISSSKTQLVHNSQFVEPLSPVKDMLQKEVKPEQIVESTLLPQPANGTHLDTKDEELDNMNADQLRKLLVDARKLCISQQKQIQEYEARCSALENKCSTNDEIIKRYQQEYYRPEKNY